MPAEIEDCAGLMWASKNGTRLYTKKKAPRREIQDPVSVYQYVLMCRAQIGGESRFETKEEFWRRWLEKKRDERGLGREVSRALRKKYEQDVDKVHTENRILQAENEALKEVKALCEEFGISLHSWAGRRRDQVRALAEAVPAEALKEIDAAISSLTKVRERLNGQEKADG